MTGVTGGVGYGPAAIGRHLRGLSAALAGIAAVPAPGLPADAGAPALARLARFLADAGR